ncbi:hypothetical protein L5M18_22690 [Shewanella sp. SM20]|uniref:hypothetical protein n=1 Tax=Shewanella TaxID=22 RepID=UPI0018E3E362|nr:MULTISPECIES: hypothetical protein [unclassified Shewanella]MBI1673724.1 hypothetical protein [Shewanella sp. DW31]MCU7965555.1 hypothetical protein [Shewanella sp. SW32]MCU7973615.1 hypothetical protein [Shewanella sp. SW29]MCU8009417.1 hypothetical protein [Shewanella sp. SM87]MCU8059018.1 hypothetical protein [Shewanella sp. SM35]
MTIDKISLINLILMATLVSPTTNADSIDIKALQLKANHSDTQTRLELAEHF